MRSQLCIFLSALLVTAASAAERVSVVNYSDVISAYVDNDKVASKKFDNKRLAFRGSLVRMGSEPDTTYFGAVTADGQKFDASLNLAEQKKLAAKFPGGTIPAFKPSKELVFECLNQGYLKDAIVPSLKLVECRVVK